MSLMKKGHVKRFQKIINTLVKHGFGQLIHDLGIDELARHLPFHWSGKEKKEMVELSRPVRIRMVAEELGPTFVKLGQLLSTRSDILPPEYLVELRKLQDQVPPFPFSQVREIIEKELGRSLETIFKSFEEFPTAAASIGQVHRAVLPGEEEVIVKVQRPNIQKTIEQDLDILEEIASLLDKYTKLGKIYNFTGIVKEFSHILNMELNYYYEGRNAERIKKNFVDDGEVYIPEIYWDYTTQKVLTMEHIKGIKLNDQNGLKKSGFTPRKIVEKLTRAYLKQILLNGFFHGDPHPGNIGLLPDGRIYFMDFGIAGFLDEDQRKFFSKLLFGFLYKDIEQIIFGLTSLGVTTEETNIKQLRWELERLQEKYFDLPLKKINLGQSLQELMEIAFRQRIRLPAEFTLLARTFLTLEGLISELDPEFSIAELVEPFGREVLRKQFSTKKIALAFYKYSNRYLRLLEIFPERLIAIMEKGAEGNLKLKVEVSEAERLLNRLNNMVNRLSFSIVLASIIVGLCLMLQFAEVTLFRRFPLAEIGLIIAAIMGFWWLWAILRSGRL